MGLNNEIKSKQKVAFITGITGQDGSYLVELLLKKKYVIHGLIRRNSSSDGTERIKKLQNYSSIKLHYGDITDFGSLASIIKEIMPDEIYNLASQSHVKVSYSNSLYTADANGMGALRILEIIRLLGLETQTRFYQASTSEMYGEVKPIAQKENSEFHPIHHMVFLNYMLIGLLKTIEGILIFLHLLEFCLITNRQEEEKLLLQEK